MAETASTDSDDRPADAPYARVQGVVGGRVVSLDVRRDGTVSGDASLVRSVARAMAHGAVGGSSDPLGVTLAAARACDDIVALVIDAAGQRCWCRRPTASPVLGASPSGAPTDGCRCMTTATTLIAMAGQLFEVDVVDADEVRIVRLRGELDLSTRDVLRDALTGGEEQPVIVDLSGLTFIDAGGVSAIVAAKRALEAGPGCAVRGARRNVRRVFQLAGLAGVLED